MFHDGLFVFHHNDVIMTTIASQITSLTVVYSIVRSGADQWKHQSPGEFPAQRASNAENVSIWWRHHVIIHVTAIVPDIDMTIKILLCMILTTVFISEPVGTKKHVTVMSDLHDIWLKKHCVLNQFISSGRAQTMEMIFTFDHVSSFHCFKPEIIAHVTGK